MTKQNTHLKIDKRFSGEPLEIKNGYSKVKLITTDFMKTDDSGLIHGGFTFSLADYAAMIAINHPNVVLSKANTKFIKPVVIGDELIAEAQITNQDDLKYIVQVDILKGDLLVFTGEFICYTPKNHILGGKE